MNLSLSDMAQLVTAQLLCVRFGRLRLGSEVYYKNVQIRRMCFGARKVC